MFRTKNTHRGTVGFTITEMITVLAILGIASAVAIPQFSSNTEQYAQAAARAIAYDMQYAQDLAVTSQSPVTMAIDSGGTGYSLKNSSGNTLTHPITHKPYTVSFQDDPGISTLTISHSFGGALNVVFDAFGTPNTSGTMTISHQALSSNVVVTLHGATGTVTVATP
ncbi:MAG: GspH/FimT family pseudopilin [Phycisphaerae bacterium]|jgi:prepilin-type N-terminal cleavage/methylation domain-containing protein|nr:GspH/FimT family pseudopilin [Phycisphaerae bacterium]|tara:strand:+ start:45 stop:545 length:501 start_codon:yes stop_codon:yes gene_type:complete